MGVQGSPCDLTKAEITEALKKRKGRITYAAKDLNVKYETLKKKIDADPELVQLLHDLRYVFDETMLDSAEDTLMYGMGKREVDLGNALRSAFYILNNKGKGRGYTGQVGSNAINGGNDPNLRDFVAETSATSKDIPRSNQSDQSSMENQQPLLDKGQGRESDQV